MHIYILFYILWVIQKYKYIPRYAVRIQNREYNKSTAYKFYEITLDFILYKKRNC